MPHIVLPQIRKDELQLEFPICGRHGNLAWPPGRRTIVLPVIDIDVQHVLAHPLHAGTIHQSA